MEDDVVDIVKRLRFEVRGYKIGKIGTYPTVSPWLLIEAANTIECLRKQVEAASNQNAGKEATPPNP